MKLTLSLSMNEKKIKYFTEYVKSIEVISIEDKQNEFKRMTFEIDLLDLQYVFLDVFLAGEMKGIQDLHESNKKI